MRFVQIPRHIGFDGIKSKRFQIIKRVPPIIRMDPKNNESHQIVVLKGEPFIKNSSFYFKRSHVLLPFISSQLCKVNCSIGLAVLLSHATKRQFLLSLHSIDECFVSLVLSAILKLPLLLFQQKERLHLSKLLCHRVHR